MDRIEKLFQRISQSDRQRLLNLIQQLVAAKLKNMNIRKVKNTDFFRLKSDRYRIIFHRQDKEIIIDSIKLRSEDTYKNL